MKLLSLTTIEGYGIWINPFDISSIQRIDRGSAVKMCNGDEFAVTMSPSDLAREVGMRL